jgi:hypothetical protein
MSGFLARSRRAAAGFVGRRLVGADRVYRVAEAFEADDEARLAWGPLLALADDGTGWLADVDEGRGNVLLRPLDDPAEVAGRYQARRPAIDPAGPLGVLLREPVTGVDLVDQPTDPDYPHRYAMCGVRLRTDGGTAVYLGTHLTDPRIPATALLLPDEVLPGLRCTPLAGTGADVGFDSVEYDSGNENAPGDPFGRTVLTIDGLGVARLDNTHVGRHRTWHALVDPAVLTRLTGDLRTAGFPEAPLLPIPPGSSLRHLTVSGEMSGRMMLPWHGVERLPGYGAAFAALDSLIHQISDGDLPVAPDVLPPSVVQVLPGD